MKKIILAIIFGVVLVGAGVGYYFIHAQKGSENQVACAQDALLCPDGSYVSRHGQNCVFDSCQGMGPFTGKLIKTTSGDFQLITESPDKNIQEVSYALPLEIGNASDAASLIGKKVNIFGEFVGGINFRVDSVKEAGDLTLGDVKVGNSVYINGVRITLNSIVQDSRCPLDVQCIQAGSVVTNVKLKSDTDSDVFNIESGKSPILFDSFQISLDKIVPQKISSQEIAQQNYILTFKVVQN